MNRLIAKTLLGREATPEEAPVILDEYANTSSAGSVIAFHKHRDGLSAGDLRRVVLLRSRLLRGQRAASQARQRMSGSRKRFARAARFARLVAGACIVSPAVAATGEPSLEFRSGETEVRVVGLKALREACPPSEVEVADPYHGRRMRYFAMPLVCVLDLGYAPRGGAASLRGQGVLLRALDGYTRPVAGLDLLTPRGGTRLRRGRADGRCRVVARAFSPIDRRRVDPAPFYLVWSGADQNDPHTHPWPYQLARIELASFASAFPRTVPRGLEAADPGWSGYTLFQTSCASCHAINGEGGTVGPELNVPRSIVEYRPIDQIKAYIRDPQETRYTSMPPHPDLTDSDLDALIAYFRAHERAQAGHARGRRLVTGSGPVEIESATLVLGRRVLDTRHGPFDVTFFRDQPGERTTMAIARGDVRERRPMLARVHSSCVTSECLMACDCDCAEQLDRAMGLVAAAGRGVVFYLMQRRGGAPD